MRSLLHLSLLAAITAFGMSACERHLSNANLGQVKAEMTTKEVESILGPPTRIEATPEAAASLTPPPLDLDGGGAPASRDSHSIAVVQYVYQQKDRTVSLKFIGNRLAPDGISGSFE